MGILSNMATNVFKESMTVAETVIRNNNTPANGTLNTLTSNMGSIGDSIVYEMESLVSGIGQNFITGRSEKATPSTYSNKLFGAPFQLLDSVDMRDPNINPNVGTEYFRHFLAHSPILYIKPGRPKYTGGDDQSSLINEIMRTYRTVSGQNSVNASRGEDASNFWGLFIKGLGKNIVLDTFFNREEARRRMFGFHTRYREYMFFVNYMCRMVAGLMNIGGSGDVPDGTFSVEGKFVKFNALEWQDYRMDSRGVTYGSAELVGGTFAGYLATFTEPGSNYDMYNNQVKSVAFMVEPKSYEETFSNRVEKSMIESAIDGLTGELGAEIQFVTGSNVDKGIITEFAALTGSTASSMAEGLGGLVLPATAGGFITNIFHGGLRSLRGQKMLYPDIYKSSETHNDYNFSITLTSPYGDKYNYYINILVPLMHLICLAAPKLVTSNSTASPFIVQAYIPGMCTIQMGMVKNLTILKNPNNNHVSIDGFPLTVKVEFQIQELYNAMAISPIIDPSSFIYNETLNDYLANAAGLVPSADAFALQRGMIFEQIGTYFSDYIMEDVFSIPADKIENIYY